MRGRWPVTAIVTPVSGLAAGLARSGKIPGGPGGGMSGVTSLPPAARTLSSAPQSASERAIGPAWSRLGASGMIPRTGIRPCVGLTEHTPHSDAGMRSDPAVSVPSAAGTMPQASAAADPPLEPPAEWSSARGFPTWSVVPPAANSWVCKCPARTMPAAASRAQAMESRCATCCSSTRLDAVTGRPATANRSFRPTGMPQSSGAELPSRASRWSAAAARSCASSGYSRIQALTAPGAPSKLGGPPLRSAIRRWQAASSSTADSPPLRSSAAAASTPRSAGSVTAPAPGSGT